MSVLAILVYGPSLIKCSTASSKEAYLTEEKAGSMKSFTDKPFGQLKWCMSLNWPGTFFGTMPIGLIFISGKGGSENGPLTLFAAISEEIFSLTISGWSLQDFKFEADMEFLGPEKPKRKPFRKPSSKYSLLWYPSKSFLSTSTLTGVVISLRVSRMCGSVYVVVAACDCAGRC